MKTISSIGAKIGIAIILSALLSGASSLKNPNKIEVFDVKTEPKLKDWRYFNQLSPKTKVKLWTYHSKRGKRLKDWAWGWRLGWVRSCINSNMAYCRGIVAAGLNDKALVVRAEVATLMGIRYGGSKNPKVIKMLAKAFRNKRNYRNSKPMFIQERILFSLQQVGGKFATTTAARLSKRDKFSQAYWQKIERF